jgi:hypothetical protein
VLTKLLKRNRAKYLAWHTAKNGKLSRYSREGIRTLLTSQLQASTTNSNQPKFEAGLATINRLFFGDGIILVGLPVVVYLTWQISGFFAQADLLLAVFPPPSVFFMLGLGSVLGLACSQFVASEEQRENSLLLGHSSVNITEAEAVQ